LRCAADIEFLKGPRTPLVISGSSDDGKTWQAVVTLEDKPPPPSFTGIVALDTVCENYKIIF
jgi:hypothetical protein